MILLEGISKKYPKPGGGSTTIFEDLWLQVNEGEFLCVIGHSGCGKTTILNILAGLDVSSSGRVMVDGRAVTGPSLDRAVIFQGHALLPWMTALGNVAYAVKSAHPEWSKAQIREHARKYLALVGLSGADDRHPAQLSGGMKQRVGIARALSLEPKILLMDEPFSALDALTRGTLQDEVRRICHDTRQTVYMITHDVDEACYLGDRIALMTNGPCARVAEVLRNPLPAERTRNQMHTLASFYPLRNYLVEFLVSRSAQEQNAGAGVSGFPMEVTINDQVRAGREGRLGYGSGLSGNKQRQRRNTEILRFAQNDVLRVTVHAFWFE